MTVKALQELIANAAPSTADIVEDVEFMVTNQCHGDEIVARLFTNKVALTMRLTRAGRRDLAAHIDRNEVERYGAVVVGVFGRSAHAPLGFDDDEFADLTDEFAA
ncbi:hypothetical protein [Tessaracoccus sp.]